MSHVIGCGVSRLSNLKAIKLRDFYWTKVSPTVGAIASMWALILQQCFYSFSLTNFEEINSLCFYNSISMIIVFMASPISDCTTTFFLVAMGILGKVTISCLLEISVFSILMNFELPKKNKEITRERRRKEFALFCWKLDSSHGYETLPLYLLTIHTPNCIWWMKTVANFFGGEDLRKYVNNLKKFL